MLLLDISRPWDILGLWMLGGLRLQNLLGLIVGVVAAVATSSLSVIISKP